MHDVMDFSFSLVALGGEGGIEMDLAPFVVMVISEY